MTGVLQLKIISIHSIWYELLRVVTTSRLMEPVNVQLAPLMPDGLYDMHGGYNYTPSLWGHREDRTFSALQPDPPSSRSENSTRSDIKKQSSENNGPSSENTGIFYWNKVFICFVCMYHLIAYCGDRFCNNNVYITLLTNRTSNFFFYHFCKMLFVSKLNLYHINKIHKCKYMIIFIKVTLRIQIWKCLLFEHRTILTSVIAITV